MDHKHAVILAGGRGTRLEPYTVAFPKPLMPLGETPILEVILRQLAGHGFTEATLAVGYLAQLIEAYFGDGASVGVRLAYSREAEPLGTAGPLAMIEGLKSPVLVMNGDILSTLDYGAFLEGHSASGAAASIATFVRSDMVDFGVVQVVGDRITGYLEKPTTDYLVSMGVYALSADALAMIGKGERLDLPELVLRMLEKGLSVRSVPFEGYWLDIGRHDDFAAAQAEFLEHREEFLGPQPQLGAEA